MADYKEVLKSVGYPEEVLVIDFETYFDSDYNLSKMSTIEYIQDPRFEFTGCGFAILNSYYEEDPVFISKPGLSVYIRSLQEIFGKNFRKVTVVAKNCKYDLMVLAVKFGINPPHVIDIDDLLRYYDARMSHKLKDVTKLFGLPPKGDTNQFKGFRYEDMNQEMQDALGVYCLRDIEDEVELFKILLPLLTNPKVEIPVARHTLNLYLKPRIVFDFKLASELKAKMMMELEEVMQKVEWVQDYAN